MVSDFQHNGINSFIESDLVLTKSQTIFSKIVHLSPNPVIFINQRSLHITYMNDSAQDFLGITFNTQKRLLLRRVIVGVRDYTKLASLVRERVNFDDLQLVINSANGFPLKTAVTLHHYEDSNENCSVLYFQSLVRQKVGFDEVLNENKYLKEMVDKQKSLVVKIAPDGEFLFVNEYYTELFDKTTDDLIGTNSVDLVAPDQRDYVISKFNEMIETKEVVDFDIDTYTALGIKTLHFSGHAIFDKQGEAQYLIGTGHDHTELVAEHQELQEIKDELQKLNIIKDKIFSEISHDLKGPIGNLKVATHLLVELKNSLSEDDLDSFFTAMEKSVTQLDKLLHDLLDWSLIELGKITPQFQQVKLHKLLKESTELVGKRIDEKKLNVIIEVPSEINITCDRNLMMNAIKHIIDNAIRYSDSQGTIKIYSVDNGLDFELNFKDYGRGLSQDKLNQLNTIDNDFLSQSASFMTSASLDVIICRKIMEMHKGSISFKSELNKGTEVTIKLPSKND